MAASSHITDTRDYTAQPVTADNDHDGHGGGAGDDDDGDDDNSPNVSIRTL